MKKIILLFAIVFLSSVNGKQVFVDWNSGITNSTCGSSTDYACSTIQAALSNAANGDVISLSAGTYSGTGNTQLTIPNGLTSFGISPLQVENPVTIDFLHVQSSKPFLAFYGSSISLDSISFLNANSSTYMFGIFNSSLIITNCSFKNNKVSSILMADGSNVDLTIGNTDFQNNTGITGTVIYMQKSGRLNLQNVQFNYNYASNDAGAIYTTSYVNITANNVLATNNAAGDQGGFLHATDGRITITSSTISDNFADNSAGGVFLHGGRFVANHVNFTKNVAEGFGGAIHNDAAFIQISYSEFSENIGLLGGAAIYEAASAGGSIDHCTFSQNWASKGGAFGLFSSSRLTVTWSQITENGAEYGGAAYLYSQSAITMTNCTVEQNNATAFGGGIYCSDSTVNLTSSTLSQNNATLDDAPETGSSEDLFCSESPPYTQCYVLGDKPWAGQCKTGHSDNNGNTTNQGIMITAIILPIAGAVLCCGCVAVMFIQHRRGNKVPGQWIWKKLDSEPPVDEQDDIPLGQEEEQS